MGAFVLFSGMLKRTAVKLSKICNDLRLLSSGPRTGINEINLPARQPGSSIIPGKVNPVIPEAVNQVAFTVIGNDMALTMAAEAGQLQLNVMEPLIAYKILDSIRLLTRAMDLLREHCIDGISAMDFIERETGKPVLQTDWGILSLRVQDPEVAEEKRQRSIVPDSSARLGSLGLFGGIAKGHSVQVCLARPEDLVAEVKAIAEAASASGRVPVAALVVSCSGRKAVLGTHICLLYTSPSPRD